jgi:hypothetical protein
MATIHAWHPAAPRTAASTAWHRLWPDRLRRAAYVARGVLGALFDAELVLPEADPAPVRARLIELGRLDAAAPPADRAPALAAFQHDHGLPATGRADARTVSLLAAAARERRELRALGLDGVTTL